MDINSSNLDGMFRGFSTIFDRGITASVPYYKTVAMTVPSSTASETYAWLGDMPGIREWVGDRTVHSLKGNKYDLRNKDFEMTISVPRNNILDDQYGVFTPMFEKMGNDTAVFPDSLIFALLNQGRERECYDGQNFFDADHPVKNDSESYSNLAAGDGPYWYLLDCTQPLRPLIYQERQAFVFQAMDSMSSEHVFNKKEYIYGVDGRSNAGYGLWQTAYTSGLELNSENYESARKSMQSIRGDNNVPLNIRPSHLVVPPSLEGKALRLLKSINDAGATNEWAGTAEIIVSPYLD